MASKLRLESWKVESVVEEIIKNHKDETKVWNVEVPDEDNDCLVISLQGNIYLPVLNDIARAYGDNILMIAHDHGNIINLYIIPKKDPGYTLEGKSLSEEDDDEEDNYEKRDTTPHIPEDMRHTYRFYDSQDVVIPGTQQNVGNTEQSEQIRAWMKETGHTPIVYLRLDDGIHVEVSAIYDNKVKAVLGDGHAVGADGRKYTFELTDNVFPIGCSICVRATCDESGRSDVYGLDFFV